MAEDRTLPAADDATVEACGKVTEALEWVERARGHLYDFHQLSGHADRVLGEALEALEDAGHADAAQRLRTEVFGRNVLPGQWTFEIVEAYDDGYWSAFRAAEREVREGLLGGRRHVHEARMKADERTAAGREPWGAGD